MKFYDESGKGETLQNDTMTNGLWKLANFWIFDHNYTQ